MSATKQDYEAIAGAIADQRFGYKMTNPYDALCGRALDGVSEKIADHFAKNPKFNKKEFLRNCGVKP